mgnify:CR=1 FL=1
MSAKNISLEGIYDRRRDWNLTFADASLMSSMEHNCSFKRFERINRVIDLSKVEGVLLSYYKVGTSKEGADAYPPLMLFIVLFLRRCIG